MSRTLVTSGLGFFGSLAILRLPGSGSEARSAEESTSRAAEEPVTVDVQEVQPGRPASFIAAAPMVDVHQAMNRQRPLLPSHSQPCALDVIARHLPRRRARWPPSTWPTSIFACRWPARSRSPRLVRHGPEAA